MLLLKWSLSSLTSVISLIFMHCLTFVMNPAGIFAMYITAFVTAYRVSFVLKHLNQSVLFEAVHYQAIVVCVCNDNTNNTL